YTLTISFTNIVYQCIYKQKAGLGLSNQTSFLCLETSYIYLHLAKRKNSRKCCFFCTTIDNYFKKYPTKRADKINSTANIVVNLCSRASIPRAFALPKSCSAPPPTAPDKPALLLDCSKITTTRAILTIAKKIFAAITILVTSSPR